MSDAKTQPIRIEGQNLIFRLIELNDAAYLHGLRTNAAYNTHLPKIEGDVKGQRKWLEAYKMREAKGQEYYYVIERRDNGQRCGVVRLYGIEGDQFTWGSWILEAHKPPKAALESAYLIYQAAFDVLGLEKAIFDVRLTNNKAQAFHRRFGAIETHRDDLDAFFIYPRTQFEQDRAAYQVLIQQGKS